jgi:glycosyltransferase involved in cell wall biosynthesis
MTRPRIVLASRELFPFGGGGIGAYVAQLARVLAPVADVTIATADWYRDEHDVLAARGDGRVDYGGARLLFVDVPEVEEHGDFVSHMHIYSHRLLERLRAEFGEEGPDLIECSDYLGEGFVISEARRGGDPFLRNTLLAARLHTSAEMCEVLNGYLDRSFDRRISRELERRVLRDSDVLVQSGGDILPTYERYYDGMALAPAVQIRYPLDRIQHAALPPAPAEGPLRLIFVGRSERRKGVQDLVDALTGLTADWRLTILGLDTPTGPLGTSMRRLLELQAAGDPRIEFHEGVTRAEVPSLMAEHDAVVLPSHWECRPNVALEAMSAGMPVIAPPVGGYTEMVVPGVTGLLTKAPGVLPLMDTLAPLIVDPGAFRAQRDVDAIRAHALALSDPDEIRSGYLELCERPRALRGRRPRPATEPPPLVSVVIPYYGLSRFVEETVASVFAQTYGRLEVIVVNDGSFELEDVVLAELATRYPLQVASQANGGLSAARNFGIALSRGRYVLPLDADNVLEPEFVARCVELLETDDDLSFVTSWNRYVEEDGTPFAPPHDGYRPVGNWTPMVHERNLAGDGTAVFRRRVFHHHRFSEHLTSYEDWALYRELHQAGRYGHVIPEMLWRYRVRDESMLREVGLPREEWLRAELDAVIREQEVVWTSTNA